jgi:hypothetical protein
MDGKIVELLQKTSKLQQLSIYTAKRSILTENYGRDGLSANQAVRKFELHMDLTGVNFDDVFNSIEQNESVVDYLFYDTDPKKLEKIFAITRRNKDLQNSRVWSVITLLFSIARHRHDKDASSSLTSSWSYLPLDVWMIILSFVTFPGVTALDFAKVTRAIFCDRYSTSHMIIMRVVYNK